MMLRSIVLSALTCVLTMVAHADEPADLVLRGGKLITMDDRQPTAEALAVRGDRIVAVGTNKEIRPYVGVSTRVLDLDGQVAVPGFIDCHAHFLSLGESLAGLDLSQAKSWEQIVTIVAEASRETPEGQWIIGRGWHQEKWSEPPEPNVEGYPVHDALSRVTPKHPVGIPDDDGDGLTVELRSRERPSHGEGEYRAPTASVPTISPALQLRLILVLRQGRPHGGGYVPGRPPTSRQRLPHN